MTFPSSTASSVSLEASTATAVPVSVSTLVSPSRSASSLLATQSSVNAQSVPALTTLVTASTVAVSDRVFTTAGSENTPVSSGTRLATGSISQKSYVERVLRRKSKSFSVNTCSKESVEEMQNLAPRVINQMKIQEMRDLAAQDLLAKEREAERLADQIREKRKKAELARIAEENNASVTSDKKTEEESQRTEKSSRGAKRKVSPQSGTGQGRGTAKEKLKRLADRSLATAAAGTLAVASVAANKLTPKSHTTGRKSFSPSGLGSVQIGPFLDSGSDTDRDDREGDKESRTRKKKEFECCEGDNNPQNEKK